MSAKISCSRRHPLRARALFGALLAAASLLAWPGEVRADVRITGESVRNYQLPPSFEISGAVAQKGPDGATLLSNTVGDTPESIACAVVIATDAEARLFTYRHEGAPTQCVGVLAHPQGGFFLRGSDPTAEEGVVTGFTARIDEAGERQWAIADQRLVDAEPKPNGTGEFQGAYVSPHPGMAYSPQLDKFLGFTVGKLTIGLDEKFISQAHVVNVASGTLTNSGQTFGQSGVGIVGGTTTRSSDGHFLVYYFSVGDQGAFFYRYNGRQDIEFFKPRGEDWDTRFVIRMIYTNDLLYLLWTPTDDPDTQTRVTVVNDDGAELWSANLEAQYVTAEGQLLELGPPRTMWVGAEHTAILHVVNDAFYLRVLDRNGVSLGVGALDEVTEFVPVAVVNGAEDELKMLAYDESSRQIHEYALAFEDVEDFDPDAGIPDGGLPPDVGIPADIGLDEVLEAAGCCATVHGGHATSPALLWWAVLLGAAAFGVRRRRAR